MKKTLFLGAIIGTVMCSTAFGELNINVAAGETQTQGGVTTSGGTSTIVSEGTLTITGNLVFNNNATATFTATGNSIQFANETAPNFYLQLEGGTSVSLTAKEGSTATYDVTAANNGIAINRNGTLTVGKDVTLTAKNIYYSSTNVDTNGELKLVENASVNLSAKSLFHDLTLEGTSVLNSTNEVHTSQVNMGSGTSLNVADFKVFGKGTANNVTTSGKLSFGDYATELALTGTNTVGGMLDLSNGGGFTGHLLLKEGARLTQNGTLWMRANSAGILLENGAVYQRGNMTVTGRLVTTGGEQQLGQIVMNSGSATYGMDNVNIEIKNSEVSFAAGDTDMKNQLTNVDLKYTEGAAGTLKLYNGSNVLSSVVTAGNKGVEITEGKTLVTGALTVLKHLQIKNNAQLELGAESVATFTNATGWNGLWLEGNDAIKLLAGDSAGEGAKLDLGSGVTISAQNGTDATISAQSEAQIGGYNTNIGAVTVKDALIAVNSGASLYNFNINGGKVVFAGSTTVNGTVSGSDMDVAANAEIKFGSVDVTLNNLTMAGGSQVTLGDNHDGALKLTKLTVTDANAAINANLNLTDATVVLNGNTLDLGCSLTLGNTELDATLPTEENETLALFTGVDSLTLADGSTATVATTVDASPYIRGLEANTYNLVYSGVAEGGMVSIQKAGSVPEPTTGTLGLLALAGLMARRRRK